MRCLSLFSGIGGIDLAAQAVGFEIVACCEIDPFCRAVLSTHWCVPIYYDVHEVSYARLQHDGCLPIDFLYGGPPCQPASLAGKRRGARDERWLWPEFLRVVGELRPRWCVAENPLGILSIDAGRAWGEILGTLVEMGYRCGWGVWGACEVGAPHRRERVFLLGYRDKGAVADPEGEQCQWGEPAWAGQSRSANGADILADAASAGLEKRAGVAQNAPTPCTPAGRADHAGRKNARGRVEAPQCRLGGMLDGLSPWLEHPRWPAGPTMQQAAWEPPRTIPRGVDPDRRKRLHALGNAVVPAQIMPLFGAIAIAEAERQRVGRERERDKERT